ncbi:MAG: transcriptional repressor [Candidatus Marinimicrobia bacterium]|nr:transcriptional repressor [Candidatus Neomarinimicrobiota bacterium]
MKTNTQRYSEQRSTILRIVKATTVHPNADWVYKETQKVLPRISLGTVYRNLHQLAEQGQITMIKDKTLVRYDGNTNEHAHFRCTTCRTWYDIDVREDNIIEALSKSNKFQVSTINLELEGTCESCLNNA